MSRGKQRELELMKKAYEKGYAEGFRNGEDYGALDGFEYATILTLFYMKEKRGWKASAIKQLYDGIDSYNDAVRAGNFNFRDIKQALKDEYDIEFVWIDDKAMQTNYQLGIKAPLSQSKCPIRTSINAELNKFMEANKSWNAPISLTLSSKS